MIRIGTFQQSATGVSTRMMTGSWQHLRVPGSRGPRHRQRGAVSVEAVLLLPLVILIAADTLSRRVGTRGSVSASVSCTVSLSDLGLPLPGSIHVNGSAQAPVDSHRERTP